MTDEVAVALAAIIESPCDGLTGPLVRTRMRFQLRRRVFRRIGFFETSVALAWPSWAAGLLLSTSMVLWAVSLGGFGAYYFRGSHRWLFTR
jgi:hypothetical protein